MQTETRQMDQELYADGEVSFLSCGCISEYKNQKFNQYVWPKCDYDNKVHPEIKGYNFLPWPSMEVLWNKFYTISRKLFLVKKAGWTTKSGVNVLTKLGMKILQAKWNDLSPAAQNVISNLAELH